MAKRGLKQLYWVVAAVPVICGGLMAGACLSSPPPPQGFTLVWNYDTSGYMETCGCSSHQFGGLPRRATLIAQLREKSPVLALEGAHVVEDKGDFQLFKGEMIVTLLNQMGYHGMMLGVREAQHGAEGIAKLKAIAKFPFYSANLNCNGELVAEQSITVPLAGNQIFITGVSQPELANFELPAGVSFTEPGAALDAALAQRKAGTTMTLISLEGETSWIDQMMQRYKGQADLFLTGDRTATASELVFTADPPRINNWDKGRFTSVVTVDPAEKGYLLAGQNMPLQDSLVDDPGVRQVLDKDYKTQLKDRFFGTMKEQLGKLYMPPDSCAHCHEEAYAVYAKSGHARALITLEEKGQQYNPDCMKCHVSYDSGDDKLVTMDCTTCHTNIDEQHIWDANLNPDAIKAPTPAVTTYTYGWCVKCHDEANSVRFKDHWPQMVNHIAHGGDLGPAQEAAKQLGIDMTAEPPGH